MSADARRYTRGAWRPDLDLDQEQELAYRLGSDISRLDAIIETLRDLSLPFRHRALLISALGTAYSFHEADGRDRIVRCLRSALEENDPGIQAAVLQALDAAGAAAEDSGVQRVFKHFQGHADPVLRHLANEAVASLHATR